MKKLLFALLAVAVSPPLFAQVSGTITSSQLVCIGVSADHSTVGVQVTGTWTGTLQPQVAIQGQALTNSQVVPSTSTTAASTITANGVYYANVGSASQFCILGNTVASGSAVVFLNAAKGVNASTLGGGGGSGTALTTVRPVINVTDATYGAATSNTAAQNNTAFTAAAAAANAITLATGGGGQATVYIPYGNYSYSGGLVFTQNVTLECETGTTLSYTGSAHAADFGPTGLAAWDEKTSFYVIDGCGWTGGASMTEGLFFNKFIAFPRVTRNKFYNFGNATSTVFQLWFDSDNYSTIVDHNFVDSDDTVARNHLKMNNLNANGNSLLDYHDNYLISIPNGSQTGFSAGIGVWADGSQSQIHDNDFNWGVPNIRFGNFCQGCYAHDNYMETLAASAAIEVGAPSTASCPDGVTIKKSYFNAHSAAWLVGPSASNTGVCTNMVVDDITLVGYPGATPLVKLGATTANGKNNSISNITGLPAQPITASNSDIWQILFKPGATDPIAGTDVWAVGTQGSSNSITRVNFNPNGGQPILSVSDSTNAVTTMAATQSTTGGAAGTFTNHPYTLRTNNVDRMTFDTSGNALFDGPNGSNAQKSYFGCETANAATTLSTVATTTDTGLSCLPINAVIDSVVYRITTTITTAASFTIGDPTTAARFCSTQSTLTAGTTGICFVQADQTGAAGPRQTAAAKVRVTANVNPGAGAIRLIVYYHTWTAPTS